MGNGLKRFLVRLNPQCAELGLMPYVWLIYLAFLYFPLLFGPFSVQLLLITVAANAVFLPLYFGAFANPGRRLWPWVGGILLIGMAAIPFTTGAMVFFVYAASFVAFNGNTRAAFIALGGILAIVVIEYALIGWPWQATAVTVVVAAVVGVGNIFFYQYSQRTEELKQSREEVQRLATLAERERIARDLHDLLGHTLSLIAIKAELAGKLLDREEVDAARGHLGEVEDISRDALTQVRTAIAGFRSNGIESELDHARPALNSVGCDLDTRLAVVDDVEAPILNALALAVREALMNVVRHANATRCWVAMQRVKSQIIVTIADNGTADSVSAGLGLTGLQERLSAVGGRAEIVVRDGGGVEVSLRTPVSAHG